MAVLYALSIGDQRGRWSLKEGGGVTATYTTRVSSQYYHVILTPFRYTHRVSLSTILDSY